MKINNNNWNKIRYTIYSPVYDYIATFFSASRKQSISLLNMEPGSRILISGAGTGLDLVYLPSDVEIVATDITPSMVDRINQRAQKLKLSVTALQMDSQNMNFSDQSFDCVILHLIVAVIPDPYACIKEAERVLKPGGEAVVLDKFIAKGSKPGILRKLFNLVTNFFFSDITRSIEDIVSQTKLIIIEDIKADLGGKFRIIKLQKPW